MMKLMMMKEDDVMLVCGMRDGHSEVGLFMVVGMFGVVRRE